ncbi:FxsA family protein [Motiliproteus sp. SC1-56]|uniref:FxsA family protein n=1 Tax=Motiliproteus sp. SC1-56 TaxID=2799565 RepID=UPI001A8EB2A0|nr:FxsA family protein [Motiliproteus sp. SC1-56]
MPVVFLLFIIIPIIEIVVLINVGQSIGAWYTVGLVLLSAFIGVNMLRYQGVSTLMRARSRIDSGEIPAQEMIEGLLLAVGGALLITPGFVTDFFGFCCLIPATRRTFVGKLKQYFTVMAMKRGGEQPHHGSAPEDGPVHPRRPRTSGTARHRTGEVIDGEYRREDDPR